MSFLLGFRNADLGYNNIVLRRVNLDVHSGDYLGIVGPNGAGKTTLLKAILGLIRPMAGSVLRPNAEHRIGYVPQRDLIDPLFPLTVRDIVLMGLYDRLSALGRPGRREYEQANTVLDDLGILELADRPYRSLSGGQKQRCIIARALVARPDILLLDEPTNGMDLPSEQSILALIDHLHAQHNITVLLVSHMLHVVLSHARRVAIVGDGTVSVFDVSELLDGEHLSRIYQLNVRVAQLDGMLLPLVASKNSEAQT